MRHTGKGRIFLLLQAHTNYEQKKIINAKNSTKRRVGIINRCQGKKTIDKSARTEILVFSNIEYKFMDIAL